jgi:glucose-1-phosphate thymidylyltransferase
MIGILLAGGNGSRLFPTTVGLSKHLLPIYDKPMIYYSLSVLMLAGVRTIVIVCKSEHISQYRKLLGNGSSLGIKILYQIQDQPKGIVDGILKCKSIINGSRVMLVLGDNIFFGANLTKTLIETRKTFSGAALFGYRVKEPQNFGVAHLSDDGKVISIEEKPRIPKSDIAVTGLYYYDNTLVDRAESVKPSVRGETEISCLNQSYLRDSSLTLEILGRGVAWLDTGTPDGLLTASQFVETIENRQGQKIACIEEIALMNGWINSEQVRFLARRHDNSQYGNYLCSLLANAKAPKRKVNWIS